MVKLAGNFLLTAAIECLAESAAVAEKNGVPRRDLITFFVQTLFNCPIYNNYGKRLIDADFDQVGFALPLALKDMNLADQIATAGRAPAPVLGLLRDRFLAALANGRGDLDAAALALARRRMPGSSGFPRGSG